MDLQITLLQESPFTYDDVATLLHSSFDEHLAEGLHFTCSTMNANQVKEKSNKGIVLVAWDKESGDLLGTATVTLMKDRRGITYGYHENLAVSPSAKRLGIGSKLLERRIIIIINAGGQYVISDTAVGAISSVKWHRKNGFKIIGLASYQSTNYYSYVFRKQLVPSPIWDSSFFCRLRFFLSSVNTRLRFHADGTSTHLGSIINKILR